jgi:hypothetical protein
MQQTQISMKHALPSLPTLPLQQTTSSHMRLPTRLKRDDPANPPSPPCNTRHSQQTSCPYYHRHLSCEHTVNSWHSSCSGLPHTPTQQALWNTTQHHTTQQQHNQPPAPTAQQQPSRHVQAWHSGRNSSHPLTAAVHMTANHPAHERGLA